MGNIRCKIHMLPKFIYYRIRSFFQKCKVAFRSFTYNHFMDTSYAADVCMEPLFWFVDNFTYAIGPIFVAAVICLTASVVCIAYWLGLPYWWNRSPVLCVILVTVGNWLLVNISFHYYMAVTTYPGYPPQGELITEAVSICKKCIAPKPPRTHHCSVCNRCILKMDHHCPWLNNCVGYHNHRYFFLYMAYMVAGVTFLLIFGAELVYNELWVNSEDLEDHELEGHPVKFNKTGALIAVTDYIQHEVINVANFEITTLPIWRRRSLIYMALLNCGVLVALGGLVSWHSKLISKGETSIEANINRAETNRLAELGRIYINPYNFGSRKNWRLFLGLVQGRSWVKHVFLPSGHVPLGNGLTWHTINDDDDLNEWP